MEENMLFVLSIIGIVFSLVIISLGYSIYLILHNTSAAHEFSEVLKHFGCDILGLSIGVMIGLTILNRKGD